MTQNHKRSVLAAAVAGACLLSGLSQASSHREAPFITEMPKVDGTDFYMFRSYETGRDGFVTLVANYLPLQDAYGGPNYFDLDEKAIYEIHIDNTGDAVEDLTFQFQFSSINNPITLDVGNSGSTSAVAIPLKGATAGVGTTPAAGDSFQTSQEYELTVISGDRRTGTREAAMNVVTGQPTFRKPVDNIGGKTFSDYAAYANSHVYDVAIPNCSTNGRVFVGQRKEAFAVNLGEIFDLVNTNPVGARNAEANDLADKNVTSFALEVPTECLTGTAVTGVGDPVIGAWTTASVRQARVLNPTPQSNSKGATVEGGAYAQVSRLGMPLVNEVVIGLPDKDAFNTSEPADDGQFATYVTNPTLPELLEILFGVTAPNNFPRTDLVTAFLTGVENANQPAGVVASEMLRLNPAVAATDLASQNDLGFVAGDSAGFPNGRRPIDDVVDVALRVAMGALQVDGMGNPSADAPDGNLPYTDGVQVDRSELPDTFPYLATPIAGSPNS